MRRNHGIHPFLLPTRNRRIKPRLTSDSFLEPFCRHLQIVWTWQIDQFTLPLNAQIFMVGFNAGALFSNAHLKSPVFFLASLLLLEVCWKSTLRSASIPSIVRSFLLPKASGRESIASFFHLFTWMTCMPNSEAISLAVFCPFMAAKATLDLKFFVWFAFHNFPVWIMCFLP